MINFFNKNQIVVLSFGLLLLPALGQSAELYKWTDKNGVVQYTQHPPREGEYTTITKTGTKSPNQPPKQAAPTTEQTPTDAEDKPAASGDDTSEFIAAKKKNCEIATTNRATLTSKARIGVRGADGQQRILTDEEKAKQLKLIEEQIKTYCN